MSGQSLSLFEQIRNRVQSQDTGEHGSRRGEEEEQRRREFEALLAEKRAKEEELKRVQVNLIDVQNMHQVLSTSTGGEAASS